MQNENVNDVLLFDNIRYIYLITMYKKQILIINHSDYLQFHGTTQSQTLESFRAKVDGKCGELDGKNGT